jgi:hypothetical protein
MKWESIICPQCGGALPRQALWRTVVCPYCGIDVVRSESVVRAASFHEAYLRARQAVPAGQTFLACKGERYRVLATLGNGAASTLLLGERAGPFAERVVIKRALAGTPDGRLRKERDILQQFQQAHWPGAAYFSQRLPQPVAFCEGDAGELLVLRHPAGYWGSLAEVKRHYPNGIAPEHAVWMWRRGLEVLAHVHANGWVHGRLSPDHLLVNPRDHGILIVGWADARHHGEPAGIGRDLAQLAWSMRAMLASGEGEPAIGPATPGPLAALLARASESPDWCASQGAAALGSAVATAAHAAFGAPRFIRFTPHPTD